MNRICEYAPCSNPLQGKRPDARFCSDQCRYDDWDAKHPRIPTASRATDRAGSRGGSVRSVEAARDLQEASPDKAYWSAKVRRHIGRTLLETGYFHPDDLDALEIPADCANVIGAQINSYSRRGFMVEVGRRRMAHKAANGRKATIWQVTDKGRRKLRKLVGLGAGGGPREDGVGASSPRPAPTSPVSVDSGEPASLFPDDTGKAAPLNPLRDREAA